MKNILSILLVTVLTSTFLITETSKAAVSPIGFGLMPPLQFPPTGFNVVGLRVSALYGQSRSFYGIDLGVLGNITDLDFAGIAVAGIFNYTKGNTTIIGLQLAGAGNFTTQKTSVVGFQLAGGINSMTAASSVVGLQFATLANLSPHTDIYGFQVGLYNTALNVYGFQIGLVNVVESLHGLQIGLINFHKKGLFAVSPIINFGF